MLFQLFFGASIPKFDVLFIEEKKKIVLGNL